MKVSDVNGALGQSYGEMEVGVMKSMNEHKSAGMGCFARLQCGKRKVLRYFSGTLMYTNLYGNKYLDTRYGEGVTSVSVNELQSRRTLYTSAMLTRLVRGGVITLG